MTKEEFYLLNYYNTVSEGRPVNSSDLFLSEVLKDEELRESLVKQGFLDETEELTRAGRKALAPFSVDNAVILAAGAATRFIPLSLEQPKGLYEVKGEKLIERQIRQLMEAGISDITIVLGYKQEMYAWLSDKYPVKLLLNPLYYKKNNIESLSVAREELKNTYICTCDSYFTENPFQKYEYRSFYAGYRTNHQQEEMYAIPDGKGRILDMEKGLPGGSMLLGHSFWTRDFSEKFLELVKEDEEKGAYANRFWEWMVKDHLDILPPIYFKEYKPDCIFEFDYFEQLRQFDHRYLVHADSEIIRNIKLVFRCDEEEIMDFRNVSEGLTNTSFIFRIQGEEYIYRHPGEGTEVIINRKNEKQSLLTARKYGIDPTYIYMDVKEGWKISRYIPSFRVPDYQNPEDSAKVLSVLRKLHSLPVTVSYGLDPVKDALALEALLKAKDPGCFVPYEEVKKRILSLYEKTEGDGVKKCFCHGDSYKYNWMILPEGQTILIDWEYAGFSDPGIDVGYYIVDAMYPPEQAKAFIREYLQENWSEKLEFHYLTYTAVIAWYWFVWAMYREECGADMKEYLHNWYRMADIFSNYLYYFHKSV